MIDIGLTKLALIGVVALVVIGPERLPKMARMVGTLFGRAQRYLNQVKTEVSREIELDELRKIHRQAQDDVGEIGNTIVNSMAQTQNAMQEIWSDVNVSDGSTWRSTSDTQALSIKAKNFRKKRLARATVVSSGYKNRPGHRTRVISAAARVSKYRPNSAGKCAGFY